MAIIEYSRDVMCKDCSHCVYYFRGKRKLHWCTLHNESTTLRHRSFLCVKENSFVWNPTSIPKYDSLLNK